MIAENPCRRRTPTLHDHEAPAAKLPSRGPGPASPAAGRRASLTRCRPGGQPHAPQAAGSASFAAGRRPASCVPVIPADALALRRKDLGGSASYLAPDPPRSLVPAEPGLPGGWVLTRMAPRPSSGEGAGGCAGCQSGGIEAAP
jgi:hypothetical protein